MCGRFALTLPSKKVMAQFNIKDEVDLTARYNIAPTQQIAVIRPADSMKNKLVMMRWGLVPNWAKDIKIGYNLINARAESLEEKPSFHEAYTRKRCLIPADGFYEWKHDGTRKQPYFIKMKNSDLFAMAGLWDIWKTPKGKNLLSCAIIVTEANGGVAKIHDRMPVIIKADQYGFWLDPRTNKSLLREIMRPYNPFKMVAYPVSRMCNNPRYDSPGCIKKIDSM